ncbi:phage holin family protein [Eubacteriales bacterium OttesenSCG-928-G02]|nr:phage holin family protein [Eubacteriales bacterium OttesenSCG-928-G02]
MTDLTGITTALISLLLALITTFLIPFIKSKMDNTKFEGMKSWVKVAVEAAEMMYNESGMGEKKKNYVLKFLEAKGYTVDLQAIDALIESAVLGLKKE